MTIIENWIKDDSRVCRKSETWRRYRPAMRNRLLMARRAMQAGDYRDALAWLDSVTTRAGDTPFHISHAQQRLVDCVSLRAAAGLPV